MRTKDNLQSISFPLPLLAFAYSLESVHGELTDEKKNFIDFGAAFISALLLVLAYRCMHLLGVSGVSNNFSNLIG